jgi:hypothetical protein
MGYLTLLSIPLRCSFGPCLTSLSEHSVYGSVVGIDDFVQLSLPAYSTQSTKGIDFLVFEIDRLTLLSMSAAYIFIIVPFGYCCSPATFQRRIRESTLLVMLITLADT